MSSVPQIQGNILPVPGYPQVSRTVAYTGTAGNSAAFAATTRFVRVRATTDCFIAFGSAVTATTSNHFLAANETQDFGVTPGDRVSAIRSSVDGTLYMSEFRTYD